ncbi:hypothetical protein GGTG_04862 [Gaeumannomyces tritici R3-111a-1]|uniref:Uncharacterized protein n=1 Tax=Gaeumannomyces tritici (strain R3-111a-1) TaxID=644352 RepID=J3NUA8_GAET3|nr:hypothetical protein GGTG_04862 [Gaeumannomyces tritici R3-111a-1]EJT79779.1 hypothetical protein GGTG_04862 [Gaeumannomyces tritici R3-111a-1]
MHQTHSPTLSHPHTKTQNTMPMPTLRTEQRYLADQGRLAGQTALAAARERNAEGANGRLDISEGTAAIHPNTGIRKAHSVGCTQSMEHSSGMWYDGRELGSGTLEKVDFEPVQSPCGAVRPDGALFMCYYDGELYADSEACYSDEDEDVYGDDDDDEDDDGTDGAATNDDDDDDEDADSESPDDMLYMRYCSDSKQAPAVVEHELDMDKLSFGQCKHMSSPVDPHDLHGRLMLVQGQDFSS